MKKRRIAVRVVATPAHLDGLIEEATADEIVDLAVAHEALNQDDVDAP